MFKERELWKIYKKELFVCASEIQFNAYHFNRKRYLEAIKKQCPFDNEH